jgi:hypothetical protein
MPNFLNLLFIALSVFTSLKLWELFWRKVPPVKYRWTDSLSKVTWVAALFWSIPVFTTLYGYGRNLEPRLRQYFSSPIIATLPNGGIATGQWWIDAEGKGHMQLVANGLTCTETYDAIPNATYLFNTATCSDAVQARVWVERYGNRSKDRGEGVWCRENDCGWYIFGWKARIAILTDGLLGLPNRPASPEDFEEIARRATGKTKP